VTDPYASLNNLYATFGQVVKAVDEASQGRTEYERERVIFPRNSGCQDRQRHGLVPQSADRPDM
jgi:hypothetical protein